MGFQNGYVGVTSNEWFQFLLDNGISDEVNFWRKQTNNFNSLVEGEPFFFLVKNEHRNQGERSVLGYGTFKRYEVLDLDSAWRKYRVKNGDADRESFNGRMKSMFGIENVQNRIGCIILSNLKFFHRPVLLSKIGIDFQNSVVSGKRIKLAEVKKILEEASNKLDFTKAIPPLKPRARDREFNQFSEELRDKVVVSYLFDGFSHRKIDEVILKAESEYSRGYLSMGILHHLGVEGVHKGLFRGIDPLTAMKMLSRSDDSFYDLYHSIQRHFYEGLDLQFSIELSETVQNDIDSDEIENDRLDQRYEGSVKVYYGKRYERDPENRRRAIEIHGVLCKACGFDFESVYGERGKDFIEVHHTKPLSTFQGEAIIVDPFTDLVPVCSNCHRMIHRRHDDVLSIEELRAMLIKD